MPNLAGKAPSELVEKIGAGSFSASYINWSNTMQLLREHAPGWLPELVQTASGGILHSAPYGAFLLLRFVNLDGQATPAVPQAIMDNNNKALPIDRISARDITDTHRRGICMAAALTFGLAYELWAKIPLESGYAERHDPEPEDADETGKAGINPAWFNKAVDKYGEDLRVITESLDEGDYETAVRIYYALPEVVINTVVHAPSKLKAAGLEPVFSTANRAALKSNEWSAARNKYFQQKEKAA
jgi:hypothetical protein